MKNRNFGLLARAMVALAVTAPRTGAQSVYTPYVVTTLAGAAGHGSADGTGNAARFWAPAGLAVDMNDNLYVADGGNNTVRKLTQAGVVATLAGLAGNPGSANGAGSTARFNGPSGVAVGSAGNIYLADYGNSTIRKVTPAGAVTTLAGLAGNPGSANGIGSNARFNSPFGVAVDSVGNVYVADSFNATIRKITPAGGVTTLAGLAGNPGSADGTGSVARFYSPVGLVVDGASNVYVTDYGNSTIRKVTSGGVVTTLAGSAGQDGSADGTGNAARFYRPTGVALDRVGNLVVADTYNSTLRKVTPAGVVTTLAGAARFGGLQNYLQGVAVDSAGNVYVADSGSNTIRKVTPTGEVTTLAGLAGGPGSTDGTGIAARFSDPSRNAVDSTGNVYVADTGNNTIRKVTPAGVVTTPAGMPYFAGSADGTGSEARFASPQGLAVDSSNNVYVADTGNHTIRKMTPAGVVTTLAGSAGSFGSVDGIGSAANFYGPSDVAVDSAGNVYVADTANYTIRKVTPVGMVTTLAGLARAIGKADGTGSVARFDNPSGVAVDSAGNVYVADFYNDTIRKVTPVGVVTTLAGLAGNGGSADGTGNAARFSHPNGVAVDSAGNVYVADSGNNTIRKSTPLRLQFDTSASSLAVSNGFFQMRLSWPSSTNVVVEASSNFQTWTSVQTNALPSGGVGLAVLLGTNLNQFFRAQLAP